MAQDSPKPKEPKPGEPQPGEPKPGEPDTLDFEAVLEEELVEIEELRRLRAVRAAREFTTTEIRSTESTRRAGRPLLARAHGKQLVGLAFSGGGIRSATFNLGILQALAQLGLLRYFDYLSTVSGGGYIGGWLAAWIKRRGLVEVCRGLAREHATSPSRASDDPDDEEASFAHDPDSRPPLPIHPISYLRSNSNYLTPHTLLSAHTLAIAGRLAINIVMNAGFLVLLLLAILLLPRIYVAVSLIGAPPWAVGLLLPLSLLALATIVAVAFANLMTEAWTGSEAQWHSPVVLSSLFLICVLLSIWLRANEPSNLIAWSLGGGSVFAAFWLSVVCLCYILPVLRLRGQVSIPKPRVLWIQAALVVAAFAAAAGASLLPALTASRGGFGGSPAQAVGFATWAPPAIAASLLLCGALWVLLLSRILPDDLLQYFLGIGGSLAVFAGCWLAVFVSAFYLPSAIRWLLDQFPLLVRGLSLGSALTALLGLLGSRLTKSVWARRAAAVAPYVLLVLMIAVLAFFLDEQLPQIARVGLDLLGGERGQSLPARWIGMDSMTRPSHTGLVLIALELLALSGFLMLSSTVDINGFSMHRVYRERLRATYLGASRGRKPHPYTGFDRHDDLLLSRLLDAPSPRASPGEGTFYEGPFPILNATVASSGDPTPFVFTPLHHGFQTTKKGPISTNVKAYRRSSSHSERSFFLGTAMTVSGAAVNPFVGYPKSPFMAAVLTLIGARLGMWVGNPAHPQAWRLRTPRSAFPVLWSELLHGLRPAGARFQAGASDVTSRWINVADGGYCDNLGIVELVRRRCRFILACDAEADSDQRFHGLTNAIRRCRTELGVEIRFADLGPLHRDENGYSRWHCIAGRILYDRVDVNAPEGTILYLKASLTGDEPADLLKYQVEHKQFPHESTTDQWFDEGQFESYRRLGEHIGKVAFGAVGMPSSSDPGFVSVNIESIFRSLSAHWFPPLSTDDATLRRLDQRLDRISSRLSSDHDLAHLHGEFYRDFLRPVADTSTATTADESLGTDPPRTRRDTAIGATKRFYLCTEVLRLMEDAYLALNLETDYRHPDNRGWMNLFRLWSQSESLREAWMVAAPTFGVRFQGFCSRQLGLTLGRATLKNLWDARYTDKGPLQSIELTDVLEPERRLIEVLTNRWNQGEVNPLAARVRQILLGQLRLAETELVGRLRPRPEERRVLRTVTYGIAVIAGESRPDTEIAPGDADPEGRLLTLYVRPHLRGQGLGRQLIKDLFERMGVSRTALPSWYELRALGFRPVASDQIDTMFKSVLNEVVLGEQRRHPMAGNPLFGPLPRLPYSGAVRPPKATWAHAVAFVYWILALSDGSAPDENVGAIASGLRRWAGERVQDEELAFAVREALQWYLSARRPAIALWPELQAIMQEIHDQPWFDRGRQTDFRAGLEEIAGAAAQRSAEKAELFASIEHWLSARGS